MVMKNLVKLTFLATVFFTATVASGQESKKETSTKTSAVPAKQEVKQAPKTSTTAPSNVSGPVNTVVPAKSEKKAPAPTTAPAPSRAKMAINEQGVQTKHEAAKPKPAVSAIHPDSTKR